jgi:hypothetical protein
MGVFEVCAWCRELDMPFKDFREKLDRAIRELDKR